MESKKKPEKMNREALEKVNGGAMVVKPNRFGGTSYHVIDDKAGEILDVSSRSSVAEEIAKKKNVSAEIMSPDDYVLKFKKDFSPS